MKITSCFYPMMYSVSHFAETEWVVYISTKEQDTKKLNCQFTSYLNNADRFTRQMVSRVEEEGEEKNEIAIPAKERFIKKVLAKSSG